jgi:hypothetical protein
VDTAFIYRLQRLAIAMAIPAGAVAIFIGAFFNPPYYGDKPGEKATIQQTAVHGVLMNWTHLIAQLVAAYLLPFTFLLMAILANRRSPWLASIGGLLSLLGFLTLPAYVGQDSLYYDIAKWEQLTPYVNLAVHWNHDPVMTFYGIIFGLGTVVGPTLVGLALWRSKAVPRWASVCITFSRLPSFIFGVVPFHVAVGAVLGGVVLLVIGTFPIARTAWRAFRPAADGVG